ncbi:hypothetical protein EWM64_g6919 [Hericium alpestre]|uniref:Mixed lineage kinase domain-containing protein n=1 Tax=Hericium alpestre TaxID=135208 RepID=A0A4Y9ZQP1_9AGAM|nr:hypothetical protein EWM64_g6919 [Hericium alpestre]
MALRIVKRRVTGSSSLDYAVVAAKLAVDVTGLLQFPPAAAAASIVLTILETVRDVKSNQQDCSRLSRRAARLLVDLANRMEGKWETAPKALIENVREFERTLVCIRDFMKDMAHANWVNRILSKSSIEAALDDFNYALEESARAFQIASLIEIHHAGELVMNPLAYKFDPASVTASGLIEILDDDCTSSSPPPSEDKITKVPSSALTIPSKDTAVKTYFTSSENEDLITEEVDEFLHRLDSQEVAPLVRSLLPNRADDPVLEPALDALLDSLNDFDDGNLQQLVSLSTLRVISLQRKTHEQYWRAPAPVDEIRVGDFGMKPPGADFSAFERLGNVFDAARRGCGLAVLKETSGTQIRWVDGFSRREGITPYLLPGGLEGYVPRA